MSSVPRCPNHQVTLEEFQRTPGTNMGVGICPISGCQFQAKGDFQDETKIAKRDKFGNPLITWALTQADGGTGG